MGREKESFSVARAAETFSSAWKNPITVMSGPGNDRFNQMLAHAPHCSVIKKSKRRLGAEKEPLGIELGGLF